MAYILSVYRSTVTFMPWLLMKAMYISCNIHLMISILEIGAYLTQIKNLEGVKHRRYIIVNTTLTLMNIPPGRAIWNAGFKTMRHLTLRYYLYNMRCMSIYRLRRKFIYGIFIGLSCNFRCLWKFRIHFFYCFKLFFWINVCNCCNKLHSVSWVRYD